MLPLPRRGKFNRPNAFHGFRSAREGTGFAPPVATVRRPFGAKTSTWQGRAMEGEALCGRIRYFDIVMA